MTDIRCKEEAKDIKYPVRVTSENQHNVTKHIYTKLPQRQARSEASKI